VIFEFRQDAAYKRMLVAKNIGQGAAFNITTAPLNVVSGTEGWDIHFDRIYSLGSQEQSEVLHGMPVVNRERGDIFFPQSATKLRELRIEYQDVEGRRYRQDLTIHPNEEGSSGSGYVTYAPIRELSGRNKMTRDSVGTEGDCMSYTEEFRTRVDLMKAFCDTAKAYIQIGSAALVLPILFTQVLLGREVAEKGLRDTGMPRSLILSWIFFLLAIGFGLAYQWLAIRLMWDELHREQVTDHNVAQPGFRITWWVPQLRWLNRSLLYGLMIMSFYLGAVLFVVFAVHALRK
jgi:hypothetical protein